MARPIGYYLSDGLKCDTSLNGGAGGKRLHNLKPYILTDRNGGPRDFHHIKRHEYRADFPIARHLPSAIWNDIVSSTNDVRERVVEVEWDATTFDEWRIRTVEEVVDRGTETAMLHAVAPVFDLDTSGLITRVEADGTARVSFPVGMKTPSELIDLILGNLSPYVSGPPDYFSTGTVDPTTRVQVFNFDADTAWTALTELEKLVYPNELYWTRVGTTGYEIGLVTRIGSSSKEVPLRVSRNVFSLRHETSTRKQATRIIPRGRVRDDGERMSIATNSFEVASVASNTLTMQDDIVGEDDQWNGFYIRKPDGTLTQIADSAVPDQITVADATGITGGDSVSIRLNASGDELIYVPSPVAEASYAVKAKVLVRDDIPAVDNEIANASLISWSGGLPVGAQTVGSPTVSQNTDERFASWGGTSAHVTATAGEGLGWAFPVFPTQRLPHYTPQVRLYIVSGHVEMLLVDSTNSVIYPIDASQQRAITERLGWRDFGMAHGEDHFALGTADMELRLVAADSDAEFYIDIVMVTNTVDGVPGFYDGRASNQLLIAALDELAVKRLPLSTYKIVAYDLNRTDANLWPDEPFDLGADARLVSGLTPFEATTRILGRERVLENESESNVELETEEERLTREATERRQADIRKPVPPHAQKPGCPLNAQATLGTDLEITWTPALSAVTDWRIAGVGATEIEEWTNGQALDVVDGSNLVITAPRHTLLAITRVVGRSLNRWGVYSDCAVAVDVSQTAVSPCTNMAPADAPFEYCSPDSLGDLVIHQYQDIDPRAFGLDDGDVAVMQAKGKTQVSGASSPTLSSHYAARLADQFGSARGALSRYTPTAANLSPVQVAFGYNAWFTAACDTRPQTSNQRVGWRYADGITMQRFTDTQLFGNSGLPTLTANLGGSGGLGGFGTGGTPGAKCKFRRYWATDGDEISISNLPSGAAVRISRVLGFTGGDRYGAKADVASGNADGSGNINFTNFTGFGPYDRIVVWPGGTIGVGTSYTVNPVGSVYPGDQYFWDDTLNTLIKIHSGLVIDRYNGFLPADLGTHLIHVSGPTPTINASGELELEESCKVVVNVPVGDTMYAQGQFFRAATASPSPQIGVLGTGSNLGASDLKATISWAGLNSSGQVVSTATPAGVSNTSYVKIPCTRIPTLQSNHITWRFFAERKSTITQGIACIKELQVNPGLVCCLFQTPTTVNIPAPQFNALLDASLEISDVGTCSGQEGVQTRVEWKYDAVQIDDTGYEVWITFIELTNGQPTTALPVHTVKGILPSAGSLALGLSEHFEDIYVGSDDATHGLPTSGRGTDASSTATKDWQARVQIRQKFTNLPVDGRLTATVTAPSDYGFCGAGTSLAKNAGTDPIDTDDFNRADSDTPGGNWTEQAGDADIASNELRLIAGGARTWATNGAGGQAEGFVQANLGLSAAIAAELGLLDYNAGSPNGYAVEWDGSTLRLIEWNSGTPSTLASDANVSTSSDDFVQLYVKAGVQEAVYGTGSGSTVEYLAASDGTHNSVTKDAAVTVETGSGETADYDDFLWCPSKWITVTGLSTGQRAQVVDSSGNVIAWAAESGGTATINCIRKSTASQSGGGAKGRVPFAGWDALVVTSPSLGEVARYDSAGVYPGMSFTLS